MCRVNFPDSALLVGMMQKASPLAGCRLAPRVPIAPCYSTLVVPPEPRADHCPVQDRRQDYRPGTREKVVVRRHAGHVEAAGVDGEPVLERMPPPHQALSSLRPESAAVCRSVTLVMWR